MWFWGSILLVVAAVVTVVLVVERRRGAQGGSRGSDLDGTVKRPTKWQAHDSNQF